MATFVLVHGAGDSAWYWHLVVDELEQQGHPEQQGHVVLTPEAPAGESTLVAWADVVARAAADATRPLVIVAQSFGSFPATMAAARVGADVLVLVAGMVPQSGEAPDDWWAHTRYAESGAPTGLDTRATFYHDVEPDVADEALRRGREGTLTDLGVPWPLDTRLDVPTRFVLATEDRFFPADWLRGVVRGRLHIEPEEIRAGHCVALSRPRELASLLASYVPK